MTPLTTICDLGALLTDDGRLVVRRSGSWKAEWVHGRHGAVYAAGSATGAEAALEQLASEMCDRAIEDGRRLAEAGDAESLMLVEAIRLTLRAAGMADDFADEIVQAGRSEDVPAGAVERAVRAVCGDCRQWPRGDCAHRGLQEWACSEFRARGDES
jgi:hypothetical protein